MLYFCGYCACYCCCLPVLSVLLLFMAFPAPPWRVGCRERSQRSCLRPGGLPSLSETLACSDRSGRAASVAPWPRSRHPGKRPPGCKAQRRFAQRSSSLRRVPAHCLPGATHPLSPCRRGLIQPQPAALTVQGNEQPTKFFTRNPVKNFAFCPDRCVRPWQ